jgi:hypothetical protein
MTDKVEMTHELVSRYYIMLDATSDELVSVLEDMQKAQPQDKELMLTCDKYICDLNTIRQACTDAQECNLLNLSSFAADMISDLLSMCIDANDDMSDAELIDLQMIRDHVGRDCTLVVTKKR